MKKSRKLAWVVLGVVCTSVVLLALWLAPLLWAHLMWVEVETIPISYHPAPLSRVAWVVVYKNRFGERMRFRVENLDAAGGTISEIPPEDLSLSLDENRKTCLVVRGHGYRHLIHLSEMP